MVSTWLWRNERGYRRRLQRLTAFLALLSAVVAAQSPTSSPCRRTAAGRVRPSTRQFTPERRARITAIARLIETAYPGLRYEQRDSAYVIDGGVPYRIAFQFARDTAAGYEALAMRYVTQDDAALESGAKLTGVGCRAPVELIVARTNGTAAPTIIARGQLDDEARSVDIRSLDLEVDDGEPALRVGYFGYYGAKGWFGNVMWSAGARVDSGKFVMQRLPRSYLKVSSDSSQMEGYLAPAGGDAARGAMKLEFSALGTRGQISRTIEVRLLNGRWISGVDILRQVP